MQTPDPLFESLAHQPIVRNWRCSLCQARVLKMVEPDVLFLNCTNPACARRVYVSIDTLNRSLERIGVRCAGCHGAARVRPTIYGAVFGCSSERRCWQSVSWDGRHVSLPSAG